MKYLLLLFAFILCSCTQAGKDRTAWQVVVLRGPSAIALAEWIINPPQLNGRPLSIQVVDSPELVQAALIKGEADIAILPMISAANLYNKGIHYTLAGCPIWGTLYLVGKSTSKTNLAQLNSPQTLYLFGAGTTPDILARHYLNTHKLDYTLNYSFPTAQEVLQALIIGKAETAILSEPFLSAALAKDSTLQILADLNNPQITLSDSIQATSPGFPQTAILYSPTLEKERVTLDSLLLQSCRFATEQPAKAIRIVEKENIFATGMLTAESVQRCKIQYIPAREAKEDILSFLHLILIYEPKALGEKLPNAHFIPNAL